MALAHDKVRKEILAEAERMLEASGIDALKARSLATAAKVSVGTFYNLFGSIEGLMQEINHNVMDEYLNYLTERIGSRISERETNDDEESHLIQRLMLLAEVYLEFIDEKEKKWVAVLAFNAKRDLSKPDEHFQKQQKDLLSFVGILLKDTTIAQEPKVLAKTARSLWSCAHGIIVLNYIGIGGQAAKENCLNLIEIFVTCFVKGLYRDGGLDLNKGIFGRLMNAETAQ